MAEMIVIVISLFSLTSSSELIVTVKRAKKRRELSFGGDEILQAENMLQKEAYRTLKLAKAEVGGSVLQFLCLTSFQL